ncbi:hypothetical protein [Gordonia spumicola]|uniref:hypothetical protein n=1 Tax=Gordonia spumicola TaxID=589161 RepID=UPI00137A8CF8|nr:hypothetical protein [Gordonia spumicola]
MQGYGPRGAIVGVALLGVLAAALSGCGLLSENGAPDRIVIPATDQLSTESKPATISASVGARTSDNSVPSEWSYERVIKSAPRVSNSDFQEGATSQDGDREDVSGYHFSSADRSVRCSTGNNGAQALACVSDSTIGPASPPADEDPGCTWDRHLVVLSSDGVRAGGCSNRYSVLYRSHTVAPGSAITVDRFACLSETDGLYCVESSSGSGFSITPKGYKELRAADRAPESLTGVTDESSTPNSSSSVVPTR